MRGRAYSDEEIQKIIKMYNEGSNFVEIGRELGRHQGSIRIKVVSLGLKINKTTLYDIAEIRPYLVDIEEAKKITTGSDKKVRVKCPNCKYEKEVLAHNLVKRNHISCQHCSKSISYGESFMTAVNEYFGLGFISEQKLEGLDNRRCDFVHYDRKIMLEVFGSQHYDTDNAWYETASEQDEVKRKYARDNGWTLIELDASKSDFSYLQQSINNELLLPNITEEDVNSILKMMKANSSYNVGQIVEDYKNGLSTIEIGKKNNVSYKTICRILQKNNIKLKGNYSKQK